MTTTTEPKAGECWHDGKGVHVRIKLRNAAQTRFRRPHAFSDSIWATVDFDDIFELCSLHPPEQPQP